MERHSIRIADAPPGFLRRPEFQPKAPPDTERGGTSGGEGAARAWLPEDPFFAPLLDPAAARRPLPDGVDALFRAVEDRWRLPRSPCAQENLTLLSSGRARLVVTGQQPAFLSGPLYTVWKAISAAATARRLGESTGVPHIPVFWVASEDHDLDEARTARFPGPEGESLRFSLPYAADRRPLSAYAFDRAGEEVLEAALSALDGRRHAGEARALGDVYRGRDLAGGFAALIASLLGQEGLLVIEPEVLRRRAAPIFRRCLVEAGDLEARIEEGIRAVTERGIRAQAQARFPLFLLVEGKRHHLSPIREGGKEPLFRLDGVGTILSLSELLRILDEEPDRFSASVLLRPVVQDTLLPNTVYLGGPAEMAYFAQLRPVYRWFGLPPPPIALRLSATLIEGKVARAMRRLGLPPEDPRAAARWASARTPADLLALEAGGPEPALRACAAEARAKLFQALASPGLPPPERKRLEGAAERIASDIERLAARAGRAAGQAGGEDLALARKVFTNFFPDGVLQERRWNILYYVAKYGTGWIGELLAALARDPFRVAHRWVFFDEAPAGGEDA